MRLILRSDRARMKGHARLNDQKTGWECKETGAPIHTLRIGRTVWEGKIGDVDDMAGEVRQVDHLWCSCCEKKPVVRYGEPVLEDELEEI